MSSETPGELQDWARDEVRRLRERLSFLEEAAELHADDVTDWCRHVAEASAQIRETAYRLEYLTSSFAASEELLPVSEVAKLVGIGRAGMYHRVGTKKAKALMFDVFGGSRQLRLPEVS